MPRIDLVVEGTPSRTPRARQVEAIFDVPPEDKQRLEWHGDVDLDFDWQVGLIVGPSGSGKSTVARELFGDAYHPALTYDAPSVLDDVRADIPIKTVGAAFSAVGFNTIPAWLRPYSVLSNGERFRADLARRLLECGDLVVVDEFTSVVDRQVAQIGAHAVQKHVRKHPGKRFVAVTCHYDVIDWLQPDWILEPDTMAVQRREVQRRPDIDVEVRAVGREAWDTFAPFHYLTQELHQAAQCYVLFANGKPASFVGMVHRPHARAKNLKGVTRSVTLPDWQGLGLVFVLYALLDRAYASVGWRVRHYPSHPLFVRNFGRSGAWKMVKKPGNMISRSKHGYLTVDHARPCAVFEYVGEKSADGIADAKALGIEPYNPRRWVSAQ